MRFENVSILSVAYHDAPKQILSSEIEERLKETLCRLDLRKDMIQALTGIVERRVWDRDFLPSDAATLAGQKALDQAQIEPGQVGVLINTSVSRDYLEPSVSCFVHRNLKLSPDCLNFDVSNACLGFTDAMQIVGNMLDRGQIQYGLLVDGENSSEILENTLDRLSNSNADLGVFQNNFAALTLGSGAAAMVLTRSELAGKKHRLLGGVTLANSNQNRLCLGKPEHMVTDSKSLLHEGVALAGRTLAKGTRELGWNVNDFDSFIMHQVGGRHIAKLNEALQLPDEKVFKIFQNYGNMGPASVPITLAKAVDAGFVGEGSKVALMGIGSGLNCSIMELEW